AESGRRPLTARQVRERGVERARGQGDALVEAAARHVGDRRVVPVRKGAERRLAQAGPSAPGLGPANEESVTAGACVIGRVAVALLATSVASAPAVAQQPLTREQVLAALADATAQTPADFTGRDLSGLDFTGVDFKRANLTRRRLIRSNFTRPQLFAAPTTD